MVDALEGVLILGAVALDVYAYKKMKDAEDEAERMRGMRDTRSTWTIENKEVTQTKTTEPASTASKWDEETKAAKISKEDVAAKEDFDQHAAAVNTKMNTMEDDVIALKEKNSEQNDKLDQLNEKITELDVSVREMIEKSSMAQESMSALDETKLKTWVEERVEAEYVDMERQDRIQKLHTKQLRNINKKLVRANKLREEEMKQRLGKRAFARSMNSLKNEIQELLKKEGNASRNTKAIKGLRTEVEELTKKQKKAAKKASTVVNAVSGIKPKARKKSKKELGDSIFPTVKKTRPKQAKKKRATSSTTRTRTTSKKTKTTSRKATKGKEGMITVTTEVPQGVETKTEITNT